ncbi:tRNA preQ1(34) S-adenosylmethionine ribosyltransferase-isomerase QueA [Arcobacter sp. FWKO B]|uniref:tRNA preQ1(34) S-adenosylmethionine ribosyltransferase-isomerase QueA n=1 Tax=Arcobacter sp. FWKO B TaxID=2593672 RepID=UPI0018A4211A|nr:tRNA preQ1(34) S-adenosylmethionine ribosyltransferase-isomerase QueA [Arcobacter sp. FWKO B]QOG11361.1 tRNA preQ1(34) S-adenosylmethionine ribosyltransferase-isomerase QueA [Arcobacter sp. FWKO B]
MKNNNLNISKTSSYDFFLPENLIALYPANPADSAKLLIYDRKTNTITHEVFRNLGNYLENHTIILNDTKVIKARIFGYKHTGGKIELLLNKPLPDNKFLSFIRGKVKIGDILNFEDLRAKVISLNPDGSRVVEFYDSNDISIDFDQLVNILENIGHIPLPPYINREDNKQDERDYQTLFAKKDGSVAAPTASLHFTKEMLDKLNKQFGTSFITLHVGAGTFKPVECEDISEHKMHSEYYHIDNDTINIINSDKKILAVGTTVTRTIEYYYRTKKQNGECDLFLNPNNPPQRVNAILTNFHLPKSTLIMLVASFVGIEKTMELYSEAIKNHYRFYSYGDAMLIL